MGANIKYKLDNQFFIPYKDMQHFFFGGQISGFTTNMQTATFKNNKMNVFVMKY